MVEAYTAFAAVYDHFMQEVPYDDWAGCIAAYLKEKGIEGGIVADLCCGTGQITERLSKKGYDMIGIDCSQEMLLVARQKDEKSLYLCQDVREFELYGTVAAIVSVCDSLNYITEPRDLREVFRLANNYLEAGGYLIFDMNTEYKYRELLGDSTFAQDDETGAFIWDNLYDEETGINEYALTLFIDRGDSLFTRERELHYERCYTLSQIRELLSEAGMEFVEAFDGYKGGRIPDGAEPRGDRMVVVAREKFQEGKAYR